MPRAPRDQTAGIRHVTSRGNRRQPVFLDNLDRQRFLELLEHVCGVVKWRVLAWCLMTNHVHLVLDVPDGTISTGMQLLCGDYAQGFNWRHGLTGHLFQGRFHSEPVVSEAHSFELGRYVDLNPERAGAIPNAARWVWSSCRAHLGLEAPRPFHDPTWVKAFGATPEGAAAAYARYLDAGRQTRPFRTRRGLTPDMSAKAAALPLRSEALVGPAIPDVRGQRRVQHLHRLHAQRPDAVEDPLA